MFRAVDMPKRTVFSAKVKGAERALFSVKERPSGDITIIVKHSLFNTAYAYEPSTENDRVVEEHFSVHCSPKSQRVNALKYTKFLRGDRRIVVRNYTEGIKIHKQFATMFIRRTGDLSDDRYIIPKTKSRVISTGEFDPQYFQLTFLVLVSANGRRFVNFFPGNKNFLQVDFKDFSLTLIWQYFAFTGRSTSSSLIMRTFTEEEISAAPTAKERNDMRLMQDGVSEIRALQVFDELKSVMTTHLLDETWAALSEADKKQEEPLHVALRQKDPYLKSGIGLSSEHVVLVKEVGDLMKRFEASEQQQ
jgi:hypothetical protein